jgi:hypothetical protein
MWKTTKESSGQWSLNPPKRPTLPEEADLIKIIQILPAISPGATLANF